MICSNSHLIQYKNTRQGERAIVFGTGKTLYLYERTPEERATVRVGLNRAIFHHGLGLTHWFFGDRYPPLYEEAKKRHDVHKLIHSTFLREDEALEMGDTYYRITTGALFMKEIHNYDLVNHSVVFSALQFLLYMGVSHIKIVGCDCNFGGSWKPPGMIQAPRDPYEIDDGAPVAFDTHILVWWDRFKQFAAKRYPDVKISVQNPVGLKDFFPEQKPLKLL